MQVFFSPKELFERLDQKPTWVLPMVTVIVVSLIMTLILLPTVIRPYTLENLESGFGGSGEQLERARGLLAGPVLYASSLTAALLGVPAKLLIISGIYALSLLPITGENRVRRMFSVLSHTAVISALGGVVGGALMIARKSIHVSMGLNLFFPFVQKETFLYRLLMQANFFTIWSVLVLALGVSVVGRMNTKKSYSIVLGLWIIAIVLGAAFGGLRAGFSRFS